MAQATINARLNATVKERGDKVLRDNGISTTEAIRGLWSTMARTREVPSFLAQECKRDEAAERRRKREVARGLVGDEHTDLGHELAEILDAGVFIAHDGELVGDEGVVHDVYFLVEFGFHCFDLRKNIF